jgi:hypothetical protein
VECNRGSMNESLWGVRSPICIPFVSPDGSRVQIAKRRTFTLEEHGPREGKVEDTHRPAPLGHQDSKRQPPPASVEVGVRLRRAGESNFGRTQCQECRVHGRLDLLVGP